MKSFSLSQINSLDEFNRFDLRELLEPSRQVYPNFDKWIEKVKSELGNGTRVVILALMYESTKVEIKPVGISILKNSSEEKKICLLYVLKEYRLGRIGSDLFGFSKSILGFDFSINVPINSNSENFQSINQFLKKRNFSFVGVNITSDGVCEEVFSYLNHLKRKKDLVILSIKPEYSNQIINGTKLVEFRKSIFNTSIKKVLIYSSNPSKKAIGLMIINGVDKDTPENLWNAYKSVGGISKDKFFEYFKGKSEGYAIQIEKVYKFENELNLHFLINDFTAPQLFMYL